MELSDQHVIRYRGRYYLYATDAVGCYLGYDVYLSDDLVNWTKGPRVFAHPGPDVWAPVTNISTQTLALRPKVFH